MKNLFTFSFVDESFPFFSTSIFIVCCVFYQFSGNSQSASSLCILKCTRTNPLKCMFTITSYNCAITAQIIVKSFILRVTNMCVFHIFSTFYQFNSFNFSKYCAQIFLNLLLLRLHNLPASIYYSHMFNGVFVFCCRQHFFFNLVK